MLALWEFIGISYLPFEGKLMEEYIPFNAHFDTLLVTCQRLFQIFFEFDDICISYGNWIGCICKGLSAKNPSDKPLVWTRNNIQCIVDVDNHAFLTRVYIAFLSWWALPSNVGERICPRVFIATTNLADGICINLVVPSLCCLYSGL